MKHYRSSIPRTARERVIATFLEGQKYKAECVLNGKVVGIRYFHETGELSAEYPMKDGMTHGIAYRSDIPGKLLSAEPYLNGRQHGVAKQWSDDGKLIGSYAMKHGTGVDMWWAQSGDGLTWLSEARHIKDGKWHGFEWWLNVDQQSVWQERHFSNGNLHGIERSWNSDGRLKRGYPRYWVNNKRVTKRQYIGARAKDRDLPPFRAQDNRPRRTLPSL